MPRPSDDDIRRIYHETFDELYRIVSRRCDGDRDLTQDVVQEAWLRAVHAWRSDGLPGSPLAWLITVSLRIVASHHRRRPHDALDDVAGSVAVPDELARRDRAERRSLVERTLGGIPALYARLIEAFHLDRRPVSEIAVAFGLSERAVEGRLRRARLRLRRQIESDPSREILHD